MELDMEALRSACFHAAQVALQSKMPVDISKLQNLADSFLEIASEKILYIEGTDRDPNILVRAVDYLRRAHAFYIGENLEKFEICLETLLELACPTIYQTANSIKFARDVEEGIAILRAATPVLMSKIAEEFQDL